MRIVVLDDYQGCAFELADWSRIRAAHEVAAFRDHIADEAELVRRLGAVDVLCIMRERTPVTRSLIDKLPTLKHIVTTGHVHAALDTKAAAERGIVVSTTASSRFATAELTFALLLALARQIVAHHNSVQSGGWQIGLGHDVRGKTLGVIGLGNLGAQVAGFGKAFGMNVVGWSQNLTDEQAAKAGARRVSKEELFRTSDYITVHYKLSARSKGIIGAPDIALMKPTAYLLNTSRGPLIDEAAMIAAIREGRIAGAGLDVFDDEPLPAGHFFRTSPKVIVTPHVGYVSHENYVTYFTQMVENIEGWLAGKPVRVAEAH
jgi:phosphoglycerate dehydrogenase-like enzyme